MMKISKIWQLIQGMTYVFHFASLEVDCSSVFSWEKCEDDSENALLLYTYEIYAQMKVIVGDLYSQVTFSSSAGGVLLYGDERKEKLSGTY
jgi:hypothetical protein